MTLNRCDTYAKVFGSLALSQSTRLGCLYLLSSVYSFRPSQLLAFCLRSLQTSMGTLYQQVTLKLSYST